MIMLNLYGVKQIILFIKENALGNGSAKDARDSHLNFTGKHFRFLSLNWQKFEETTQLTIAQNPKVVFSKVSRESIINTFHEN